MVLRRGNDPQQARLWYEENKIRMPGFDQDEDKTSSVHSVIGSLAPVLSDCLIAFKIMEAQEYHGRC